MALVRISKRKLFLFGGDILLILFSLNLAFLIRSKKIITPQNSKDIFVVILLSLFYIISFYIFDLYNIRFNLRNIRFLASICGSLILATLFNILFFYLLPYQLGRSVWVISLVLIGICISFWRFVYSNFFRLALPQRNLMIVGQGKRAEDVCKSLKNNPEYEIKALMNGNPPKKNPSYLRHFSIGCSIEKLVNAYRINDIVLTNDFTRNKKISKELIQCKMKGIKIYDIPTFFEQLSYKLSVPYINPRWFLYSDGFEKVGSEFYKRLKRITDLIIAIMIFILSIPFAIFICLAIKLDSKGSILFMQERLGENYKAFRLYKFRTMVDGAEKGTPKWAKKNDTRVTKVGRILRKTRLDELPQLFNIIKGEMSVIGPRPERKYFINRLTKKIPYYSMRFSVKPGLTGWAQINYRYGNSIKDALEKFQYELYYVKNMSLFLDFKILVKTIRICLFGMGI